MVDAPRTAHGFGEDAVSRRVWTLSIHGIRVVIWMVVIHCTPYTLTTSSLQPLHYCNWWWYRFQDSWISSIIFSKIEGVKIWVWWEEKYYSEGAEMFRNFEQKKLTCRNSTHTYNFKNSTFYGGNLGSKVVLDWSLGVLNILKFWVDGKTQQKLLAIGGRMETGWTSGVNMGVVVFEVGHRLILVETRLWQV